MENPELEDTLWEESVQVWHDELYDFGKLKSS